MQALIRFAGILVVVVWLGGMVCFTLVVGPAFFSAEMGEVLPRPHAARAIEVLFERYYVVQIGCGALALAQLLVERVVSRRRVGRWRAAVLGLMVAGAAWGAYWLLPSMHNLQAVRYGPGRSAEERREAAGAFAFWHGVSQGMNLAGMGVLVWHLWWLTRPEDLRKPLRLGRFGG
ncbi:MAG: DUF4149 domain-containing protein [Verrucomicrobia bacterium]|nr:MAG: DUF4149 domain-containing protein [Verrucomicrobiota bacterium]